MQANGDYFICPKTRFWKKCCKSVAKTVARKVPSPETRINTGFFGTSKPKGTTPTPKYKTDFNWFCLGILTWYDLIWYRLSQFYEVFLLLLSNSYHLDAISLEQYLSAKHLRHYSLSIQLVHLYFEVGNRLFLFFQNIFCAQYLYLRL